VLNMVAASPTPALFSSANVATQLRTLSAFAEETSAKFASCSPIHVINVYQQLDETPASRPVSVVIFMGSVIDVSAVC
jgi:hypothetical protein